MSDLLREVQSLFFTHREERWVNHPAIIECGCDFNLDVYNDILLDSHFIGSGVLARMAVKRKAEFIAGRYCAAKCLEQLGINTLVVEMNADRSPQWPAGVCGSISHSRGVAMAVATCSQEVRGIGIDIENELSVDTAKRISSQILNADELALYQQVYAKSLDFERFMTMVFSAKESIYKALYPRVQRFFGFDAVSLVSLEKNDGDSGGEGRLVFRLNDSLASDWPARHCFDLGYLSMEERVVTWLIV